VNLPLFVDATDRALLAGRLSANVSATYPNNLQRPDYNVLQAIKYSQDVLVGPAGPDAKALAYCWLFHLVGDIHQPLHAVSLYSASRFPEGDRGGNSIPLRRGRNLHALWDGLLGRDDRLNRVVGEVAELRGRYPDEDAANEMDPLHWAQESRALAESFAYNDIILNAVRTTQLTPIELPTSYMQQAGAIARQRVIAAGVRLGALLKANTPPANAQPALGRTGVGAVAD
jgi:hypothetical protein